MAHAQFLPPVLAADGRTLCLAPLTTEPEAMPARSAQTGLFLTLLPIVPETLQGAIYERSYKISDQFMDTVLKPFSSEYICVPADPAGWDRYVTPEGRPYFWHADLNVYTNVHLARKGMDPGLKDFIERTAMELRRCFARHADVAADRSDLVIALLSVKDNKWGYYFANEDKRTVFWVHPINLSTVVASCERVVPTDDHLGLIKESQFWYHVEMFPIERPIPQGTITELRGLLACAYTDTITSTTTTSPYPIEKLDLISKVLDFVREDDTTGQSTWIVARFMSVFKREMFLHYYGQDGARLNRDQSVHYVKSDLPRPRYLFLLVSSFLFYMPYVYKKKFDEVFVDSLLNEEHWRVLLENLRRDWEMTVTPSTVLLSANVAFLAIQSVDTAVPLPHRTPEQILSYISTVFSLASYLVCWILMQRHAPAIGSSTVAGITYLKQRERCWFGLEGDAIVFSLPSAFFMWSMHLFCAAIIWICLAESDATTRYIMVSVLALLALTLAVVLKVSWTSIAPLEDNLWTRHVEIARLMRKASRELIVDGLAWRASVRPSQVPMPQAAHSGV
ncbi:hypothetical protein PsYK624_101780 [Phanerochaete sordida]|uniref:WW domain-containing protein n=1 Tax=Phanerochaete sordida TaxID=48140 RepID=A0A9P3GFN1_9APHY|nr:hypothetical protein PsYK624_101780 [Phanerochaete sordida]